MNVRMNCLHWQGEIFVFVHCPFVPCSHTLIAQKRGKSFYVLQELKCNTNHNKCIKTSLVEL